METEGDFEVCSFCGELFRGERVKDYRTHYEICRDEYVEPDYMDMLVDQHVYGY